MKKFYFGQQVYCWGYNSWFFKSPKPCIILCKLPYKWSYYPIKKYSKDYKEQFWLVKIYKGLFAAIPETKIKDLKDKIEEYKKYKTPRPVDKVQADAHDTLEEWHNINVDFLNKKGW